MSILVKPKVISEFDLWSGPTAAFTVTSVAANVNFNGITIAGIPTGAVITQAKVLLKFRGIEEDSGSANALNGDQIIQAQKAVGGSWITALTLKNSMLNCPADSRDPGDVWIGTEDIKAQVPANGSVLSMRWYQAVVVGNSVYVRDMQVGVRIECAR
jgi:hypothetical protein